MGVEELTLRRGLVLASALIYWAGVAVQARRVGRRIGKPPNVAPRGSKERWLWAGWLAVVLGWIGQPLVVSGSADGPWLRFFALGQGTVGLWVGLTLLAVGYAGTLWCYRSMGPAWRMGVNRAERTALVTSGPYRWVRHPIYLFQAVMLLGVGLLLPTPVSLLILLLHGLCVAMKMTDEEAHLRALHPTTYADYAARTGRWLPRIPRVGSPPGSVRRPKV